MTTRDIVVADKFAWRQVKDANGAYVHRAEAHAYPGVGGWDETACAVGKHALCVRATVSCGDGCGAFEEPETIEEYQATLEHWKEHSSIYGGCSHGCI